MSAIKTAKLEEGSYLVDLRGWMCPYPKYMLEPILKKLSSNVKMLVLIVDCPSAIVDVPKVAEAHGHEVSEVKPVGDGEWQINIKIKAHAPNKDELE